MGDFSVRPIESKEDRTTMFSMALEDIQVFEQLLKDNAFTKGPICIGAEQELCIVDQTYEPATTALELLDQIADPHYTNELGLFNLEINLDPLQLYGKVFGNMHDHLKALIAQGQHAANQHQNQLLLTGILPTIQPRHLTFDYMTPVARYKTLSKVLFEMRGQNFEIYLQGVDDLMMSSESILFEAINTSFQLHLQIPSHDFVRKFNWAQTIAGPVLSCCVNSPMIFGRELWAESRIAVFKQSIDIRSSQNSRRKRLPRVYFGDYWLEESPANIWKEELSRFPLLITSDDLESSLSQMERGDCPDLRAIRLHNGTTYTWNRMCYGAGIKPHLRIECRYLPAGPTCHDEIANFMFWIGLMEAIPEDFDAQRKQVDFRSVKANFIKAAREGLLATHEWFGTPYSAQKLLLDHLIPLAYEGLKRHHVEESHINKYMETIVKRVTKQQSGAEWMINQYRILNKKYGSFVALQEIVKQTLTYQKEDVPIHEWDIDSTPHILHKINSEELLLKVEHLMTSDLYTVQVGTSIAMAEHLMSWHGFHFLPVEDFQGELVGIITDGMIQRNRKKESPATYVEDILKRKVICTKPESKVAEVIMLLQSHQIHGMPVIAFGKLVGVITLSDLRKAGYSEDHLSPKM